MLNIGLSFAVVLLAGLLMGYSMLKRTKKSEEWGCLTYIAFLAGVAAVLVILWPAPSGWVEWLMVVGALVLCVSVVSLTATAWRTVLAPFVKAKPVSTRSRRKTPPDEKALDEQFAGETFEGAFALNPISFMEGQFSLAGRSTSGSGDILESCVTAILLGIVATLSYIGVLLSYILSTFLMPRPTSPFTRIARAALSFAYSALAFTGVLWLLDAL